MMYLKVLPRVWVEYEGKRREQSDWIPGFEQPGVAGANDAEGFVVVKIKYSGC
jgi:hypothetical protein